MITTYRKAGKFDPTRTTVLRTAFVRQMNKRFIILRGLIRKAIVEDDVFGMIDTYGTPGRKAFVFTRAGDKVASFMDWLRDEASKGILEVGHMTRVGAAADKAWTNVYIMDSYKRGVQRARYEMSKAGYAVDDMQSLAQTLNNPFHADRLGVLYTRVYSDLKGITDAMDMQISRVLAQGIADGDNPRLLARKLTRTITGPVGDLGITDTLGRFIPAQRRAQMLARTEIIRAHHIATITEYRNWGIEGVEVQAEWSSVGDDGRTCDECLKMDGKEYTLEQIESMIPRHPNCFIDPQTPIYTSDGWKKIGSVEIGDMVLTHKKRFRKVYALPRQRHVKPEVTILKVRGDKYLSVTSNHLVQVDDDKWVEAGSISPGDEIMMLAGECRKCKTPVPYYRKYCSRTCLSTDTAEKQWANESHRQNISKKNRESMIKQYKYGLRDKDKITKAANEKARELIKQGKWGGWLDTERLKEITNTPEHRDASRKRMKEKNPMFDPLVKKKAMESVRIYLDENPEMRLNARMAKHRKSGRKTDIEKRMAKLLDAMNVDYVFQYPILRYNVDFAIPELRIVIECDGIYWHKNKEADIERQRRIEAEGWHVLRYTCVTINKELDRVEDELARVVGNHTGEYNTIKQKVVSVKRFVPAKNKNLYNLSVEEDESYIAKGFVVHNCRCLALPLTKRIAKQKAELS